MVIFEVEMQYLRANAIKKYFLPGIQLHSNLKIIIICQFSTVGHTELTQIIRYYIQVSEKYPN
jgi:hypothetical protein